MPHKFHETYEQENENDNKNQASTTGSVISLLLLILAAFLWFQALPIYTEYLLSPPEEKSQTAGENIPGDGTIPGRREDEVAFVFFDVGTGSSLLLQAPDNSTSLIDGGEGNRPQSSEIPAYNLAENLYIPFFNRVGIEQLEYMINTTPFSHYMGAQVELARYPGLAINNILLPRYQADLRHYRFLKTEVRGEIAVERMSLEQTITFGPGLKGKVLHAPENPDSPGEASNILFLQYGTTRALLMGHLPENKEEELLLRWGEKIDVELLLTGRHGGDCATGQPLLEFTEPDFAVISRDQKPHLTEGVENVLNRLQRAGVNSRHIFRTDRDSHVVFYTDGRDVRYEKHAFPFQQN